jgi:hypothetical protein
MRVILGLAMIVAMGASTAHAQQGQQPAMGSLRLLGPATPAAPAEAPPPQPAQPASVAAPSPAVAAPVPPPPPPALPAAAPAPAASGWTGPVNFSPIAAADLIVQVCRASATGEGADLTARAAQLGLGAAGPVQEELSYALPPGAVTWRVPTVDGVVYLFGYGEEPLNCGAAILRPLAEDGFNKVTTLLKDPQIGFASDSTQIMQGDVRWERLKSAKGEFIDVMEYPASGERPGVLRAEFLPH